MINYVKGQIIYINPKFLTINVGGIGYKVFATENTISSFSLNQEIALFTYLAVRENSLDLYGFQTIDELSFFEMLLDVSGVGPKSALSILMIDSIDTLKKAIALGDTSYLNKVSGIGKKTAEKIVIELRDKLQNYKNENNNIGELRDESDILEALKSLGYSQNDAREALKNVSPEIKGTNARIKEALKIINKN